TAPCPYHSPPAGQRVRWRTHSRREGHLRLLATGRRQPTAHRSQPVGAPGHGQRAGAAQHRHPRLPSQSVERCSAASRIQLPGSTGSSDMSSRALSDLADEVGLLSQFTDANGEAALMGEDAMRAVLRALELTVVSKAQIRASLGEVRQSREADSGYLIITDADLPI